MPFQEGLRSTLHAAQHTRSRGARTMLCMSWPKLSTSTGWGLISTRTSLENCSTDTCNQKKDRNKQAEGN